MRKARFMQFGSNRVTLLVLYGSLFTSLVLALLLFTYDFTVLHQVRLRSIFSLIAIGFLLICLLLARFKYLRLVSWLLIFLYTLLAFVSLLYWGLNAAVGIFTTSFVIVLSGILIGSRAILPTALGIGVILCIVQLIHNMNIMLPDLSGMSEVSSFLDVASYMTILGVFSLITWISDSQMEKNLERARSAEATIRSQKEVLASELEKQSVELRQAQLEEIQQLYRFAMLGQNAAATLHELSNHLSVLNMDMDELKQHRNSKAIKNAEEGIDQINVMVRQIRRRLDNFDEAKVFRIEPVIKRVVKDQSEKCKNRHVQVVFEQLTQDNIKIQGDPFALTQVITILLSNGIDACNELPQAKVVVSLKRAKDILLISVSDNGLGVPKNIRGKLFQPKISSKPTGLGVGLYIAKHLVESQFNGTLTLKDTSSSKQGGACFVVATPLNEVARSLS